MRPQPGKRREDAGAAPPRLSSEAMDALEREVQSVLAYESEHGGPTGAPWRPSARPRRQRARLLTAVADARILVVPVALMLLVTALIATVGDTYGLVALAFAALLVGVGLVAELIANMTREIEHLSPQTAAILEHEGVVDPDRLFGDLLAARREQHATPA